MRRDFVALIVGIWCLASIACFAPSLRTLTQTFTLRGPTELAGYHVIVRGANGEEVKSVQLSDSATATFEIPLQPGPKVGWFTLEAVGEETGGSLVRFGAGSGIVIGNESVPVYWLLLSMGSLDWPTVTWQMTEERADIYLDSTSVGSTTLIMGVPPKRWHLYEWRDLQPGGGVICTSRDSLNSGVSRCYSCDPKSKKVSDC
jgi:hypothetical protein